MSDIEQTRAGGQSDYLMLMSEDTVYTRTMRRALETLGTAERFARELGASVAEIESWAAGLADPPPGIFLKAIDIVAHARLLASPHVGKSPDPGFHGRTLE